MNPSLVLSGKTVTQKHGDKNIVAACNSKSDVIHHETKAKGKTCDISTRDRVASVFTEEEKLSQILHYHRLIISQTAGVNLLTVPTKFLAQVQQRINFEIGKTSANKSLLCVAQLELSFLIAKDCVVFFTENFSIDQLLVSQMEGICPALIFTSVQVKITALRHENCAFRFLSQIFRSTLVPHPLRSKLGG